MPCPHLVKRGASSSSQPGTHSTVILQQPAERGLRHDGRAGKIHPPQEVVAARVVPQGVEDASGETVVGRDRIRHPVGEMIRARTRLESHVVRAITVDDIALLYTDFRGTMRDESGKQVEVLPRAVEVLRRLPDGTWKLIVGDPGGRGSDAGAQRP
jgi:hypothetical protein